MDAFLNKILTAEQADKVSKIFDAEMIDMECLTGYRDYGPPLDYKRCEQDLIHIGIDCPIVRQKIMDAVGIKK